MLASPPRIGLLPEHLIDQIKAGEVIERPGNLIKEILENAIDAGSKRLELILKNNGLDLINLKDDGHGILGQDLPLAFSRHATSKISRFEDLYRLHSFGFRGEALASISAISKLHCVSFNQQDSEGHEIRIEGGLTTYSGTRNKTGHQNGTELNIQDLFYNTPVRLKFIQSQQSEKNFIKKVIFSFILAHPEIEFIIKYDEEEKEIYPAREKLLDRLHDIIPKSRNLIVHTQKGYEDNELEIFLIPGNIKAPLKFQFTYINNRMVLDKQIPRVISNALMSTFGTDDYHFIAFARLPADHIDVNVHPNKTIIKLFESSKLISLITGSIRELGQTPRASSTPTTPSGPVEQNFDFNAKAPEDISLPQTRHEYNMEGHFSPHALPLENNKNFIWINQYILTSKDLGWEAISAPKLLEQYVLKRLKSPMNYSIPLLVSEPFRDKKVEPELLHQLIQAGLELEKLGADTIVLRSIPDWMNGFPLKDIVDTLLSQKSLSKITILSQDWSQSTWEEMIQYLGVSTLRELRVSFDLGQLLEEKFR